MKRLNVILVFILLAGCERGSFLTYSSKSVFIDGEEISLLYEVTRTKFKSGFLDMHGGGKQWTKKPGQAPPYFLQSRVEISD